MHWGIILLNRNDWKQGKVNKQQQDKLCAQECFSYYYYEPQKNQLYEASCGIKPPDPALKGS